MALSQDDLNVAKAGMRLLRNGALSATDYMVLPDTALDSAALTNVTGYRTYLRDLPASLDDDAIASFQGVLTLEAWVAAQ